MQWIFFQSTSHDQPFFSKGAISITHPNVEEDSKIIKNIQDRVEDLVISYKERYGEKPPVEWLEKQFEKPLIDTRKDLQDALCYWKEFITEKKQILRNERTINRYNNLEGMLIKFKEKKNYTISFEMLDQQFFNDFLSYMVNEYEYSVIHSYKSDSYKTDCLI